MTPDKVEEMTPDKVGEMKQVLEKYEAGMLRAGVNADNVDYDRLSEERFERWSEIEAILTQYHQDLMSEVVGKLEKAKGKEGARLNTFKEGYKAGYNAGLTEAQTIIKSLSKYDTR